MRRLRQDSPPKPYMYTVSGAKDAGIDRSRKASTVTRNKAARCQANQHPAQSTVCSKSATYRFKSELAVAGKDNEERADENGEDARDAHHYCKRVAVLLERQRNVHAVDRRDERRHGEKNRRRRQVLHHVVQVVVDQRRKSIERAVQDVRVDRRRLERLLVLDHSVLELVAVVFAHHELARRVRAGERNRVGLERRREVDERLLDRKELQEHLVRNRLVKLVLERKRALVDVVKIAKEQHAAMPEKAERKAVAVRRRADAADLVEKRRRDGRLRTADGDDRLADENNAERDRAIGNHLVVLDRVWNVDDENGRIVVVVETRTFVGVEGVGEEVARNAGVRQDALKLGRGWLDEVDPTGRGEIRSLPETSVLPAVDRHHVAPPSRLPVAKSYASCERNLTSFS